jgi:hypothetical protein
LEKANRAYNDAVSSVNTRLLVQAKKFNDLGSLSQESLEDLPVLNVAQRQLVLPEPATADAPDSLPDKSGAAE